MGDFFYAWYAKVLIPDLVLVRGSGGDIQLHFGVMSMKVLCHLNWILDRWALNVRRDISLSVDLLTKQLPFLAMKIEESTIFYWFCLIEKEHH